MLLRQGTVGGFSRRMRYDLVVNTFVKDALLKQAVSCCTMAASCGVRSSMCRMSPTAHVVCFEAPSEEVAGRIFNVTQENYQVKDLAEAVAAAVQPLTGPIELQSVPATGRKRDYRTSNARLTAATGWTPQRTIHDSIKSILDNVSEIDGQEMLHPRYYNLRWMQLLTEVHESLKSYSRVF